MAGETFRQTFPADAKHREAQDALRALLAREGTRPGFPFGPVATASDGGTVRLGGVCLVDPTDAAMRVYLPAPAPADVGAAVLFVNASSSTNDVTVACRDANVTIDGASEQVMAGAYAAAVLLVASTSLYVVL